MRKMIIVVAALGLAGLAHAEIDSEVADKASAAPETQAERPNCLRHTGSRIRRAEGGCVMAAGRVYTRDDILRTGSVTAGGALSLLDPRLRIAP